MPIQNVKIPLFAPAQQNVDEIQLKTFASKLIDGYIDEAGFINKRPGLASFVTLGSSKKVDGLYWWNEKSLLIAVSGGAAYKITAAGAVTSLGTGLATGTRPTFAISKPAGVDTLFIANGGNVFYTTGTTLTNLESDDTDVPDAVTHIVELDSYLIVNSVGTGQFHFSTVLDPFTWSALDFGTAEGSPDDINAIAVRGRELLLFGQRSIETYYNDGVTPFIRLQGGETASGISAPYSIVEIQGTLYFLDDKRRFVRLVGRQTEIISTPFDRTVQTLDTVADAIASDVTVAGQSFYLITFPTATRPDGSAQVGQTYVYDYRLDRWCEWAKWTGTEYGPFKYSSHAYSIQSGINYVGSNTTDGKVYKLLRTTYQDDGSDIRTVINSGYFDHGSMTKKKSRRLMGRIKRGIGLDVTDLLDDTGDVLLDHLGDAMQDGVISTVSIKHRDETQTSYGGEITFDLGVTGDENFYFDIMQGGIYRARSYEIVNASNTPFIMGDMEEEVELLTS
ncbi:hypothetical protein N9937_02335 [bacterium]|nr:hypothetical protein [bacterium]